MVVSTPAGQPVARVVVFGLGGTIAMTTTADGGVAPTLTPQQLLDAVPGLAETGAELATIAFRSRPGASLTFDDTTQLAIAVRDELTAGAAGAVVTQGTDTIEETAYLLDLVHDLPQPIVVTGAMRNPTLAGADGPANLLAAVQVAASDQARNLGTVVVLADEIHAAARVCKAHSTSPGTFTSPNGGPLGYVVEGIPRIVNRPPARHTLPPPRPDTTSPRVGLYTATLGDDGDMLSRIGQGLDGLVVAGFGVGHVPQTWLDPLTDLAARIPVVLASRTGSGPVLSSTYGFPGSERDLINRHLIPAGLLGAYKARILLHLALAADADIATAATAIRVAGGLDDPTTWPWPTHING